MRVEVAGALEKEVAFFWEEQREPCQVDLAVVHFGLGEVGVDGDVGAQLRRQVVEQVQAFAALEDTGGWTAGLVQKVTEDVGLDVEPVALADVAEANDAARRHQAV